MGFTSHRTRAIFDRYNIVSNDDLLAAQERLSEWTEGQPKTGKVAKTNR